VSKVNPYQNSFLERIFSSRVRIQLLSHFLMNQETREHIRALASRIDAQYSAVWKELNNLENAGLLRSESIGGRKIFSLNPNASIIPELRSILLKTVAVGDYVRQSIGNIKGIKAAFIFGSYAKGEMDADSDLDLMLIGEIDVEKISPVIDKLESQLQRDVNYILFTENEWDSRLEREDPFVVNVQDEQKIMLIGSQDDL
jgi:predicted nucleotidyltransferase